ncbi:secretin N-terminal domain-containing protein [Roseateles toxinivorans]|uniref:General secretion pathway protein D n=1 Tax=Roseateles toxinivorans TaxID=270368 RepID=A0A4R6QMK5_9BURK|nr:secretin N-terminal domain-containing protein [Roseateles toxinivorans]TDP64075.1 general secretion pathway protein D [Roseateles toxinivorans]
MVLFALAACTGSGAQDTRYQTAHQIQTPALQQPPAVLAQALQKRVNLEFRDASLRQVFEALSRSSGINFVFDREVRETRLTVQLRDVTLEEALSVLQTTQQLERKLLNDRTLLIYPNTPPKQREHQELLIRSFYLTSADVKQVQTLVRTMVKTRDLFIDERLNLLVARDTPEVIGLIERLIATLDLPEPEVVMELQVLEVANSRLAELGLDWPSEVQSGLPGGAQRIEWGQRRQLRASVLNPALTATLNGSSGDTTVLAKPSLRARNREKAKIQIGERLPVFTSTVSASVGVAASVSYVDVGLKLEAEPTVQLDGDVIIKLNFEITNVLERISPGAGLSAYRVGTRHASTSLRLRDGETQILGGLIGDDDRKTARGLPYLSEAPLLGRLLGVQGDARQKTELLLLVTPHVVRSMGVPDAASRSIASGFELQPGAESARLGVRGSAAVAMVGGAGMGAGPRAAPDAPVTPDQAEAVAEENVAVLQLSTSGEITVGDTAAVTLVNHSEATVRGELEFDAVMFQPAEAGAAGAGQGRIAFELAPQGQRVLILRSTPAAAGNTATFSLTGLGGINAKGEAVNVRVQGEGTLDVSAP